MNDQGKEPKPNSPQSRLPGTSKRRVEPVDLSAELANSCEDPIDLEKVADALAFFDLVRGQIDSPDSLKNRESVKRGFDSTHPQTLNFFSQSEAGSSRSEIPERVDRFEIQSVLGQGGFARVFLAYDPMLDRHVALKVLKPSAVFSDESRDRFQRESYAAAMLSHPNIVPVFESGTFGPINFLVSEYCEGVTLGQWFEDQNRNVRPHVAAKLVARLAEAVQHAHQRGVVHRDLKPANVLVQLSDDSSDIVERIRITDFGLARFSEPGAQTLTTEGAIVGTPAYMSPEQARGDKEIDWQSDVFSLGVVLYELITGELPFRGESHLSTLRLVEESEPISPMKINSEVPRDLEAICLKCLEKKVGGRYQTAHELAGDLENWLIGMPVGARPIRSHEKAWRWCKRNSGLAAALAFAFFSLVIGLSATTWKWQKANQEKARANLMGKRSNDALRAFKFAFQTTHPNAMGNPNMTARQVLQNATQYLPEAEFDDEGKLIFYDALFYSFRGVGDWHAAEDVGRQWHELSEKVHGRDSEEALWVRAEYADLLRRLDQYEQANELLDDVVESLRENAPNSSLRYTYEYQLGQIAWEMGRLNESIELMQFGLDGYAMAVGRDDADAIEMAITLGLAYLDLEKIDDADQLLHQAYDDSVATLQDEHTLTIAAKEALGRLAEFRGEFGQANKLQGEVLESRNRRLGKNHPMTISSNLDFVDLLLSGGQLKKANQFASEVYARSFETLGETHRISLVAKTKLALTYANLEQFDEAEEHYLNALELRRELFPAELRSIYGIKNNLANVYLEKGRKAGDKKLIQQALENYEQILAALNDEFPADHDRVLTTENAKGQSLYWLKRYQEAAEVFDATLIKLERKYPDGHPNIYNAINRLAACYAELDRIDEAIPMFEKVIELKKKIFSDGDPGILANIVNYGMLLIRKERFEDAVQVLSKAVILAEEVPDKKLILFTLKTALGIAHRGAGRIDEAIVLFEDVTSKSGDDPRIGGAVEYLRKCYFEKKQIDDYLRIVETDLPLAKKTAGENILGYTGYIARVAKEMIQLELFDEAADLYRESLKIRANVDSNAWFTHNTKSSLGGALLKAGKIDEAKQLLEEAYEGLLAKKEDIPESARTARLQDAVNRLLDLAKIEVDEIAVERWQSELEAIGGQ